MNLDGFRIHSPIGNYSVSNAHFTLEMEEEYVHNEVTTPNPSPEASPEKDHKKAMRRQKTREIAKKTIIKENRRHKYKLMMQGDVSPTKGLSPVNSANDVTTHEKK